MNSSALSYQAVFFFKDSKLTKELHFNEFEGIIDGSVTLLSFASQSAKAVYLEITPQLVVKAAVFFTLSFNEQGVADTRWSIPLEQLASNSAKGPDMGCGPITLACRSQCFINWHQPKLWDPEMTAGTNHFVIIKKAVKRAS